MSTPPPAAGQLTQAILNIASSLSTGMQNQIRESIRVVAVQVTEEGDQGSDVQAAVPTSETASSVAATVLNRELKMTDADRKSKVYEHLSRGEYTAAAALKESFENQEKFHDAFASEMYCLLASFDSMLTAYFFDEEYTEATESKARNIAAVWPNGNFHLYKWYLHHKMWDKALEASRKTPGEHHQERVETIKRLRAEPT